MNKPAPCNDSLSWKKSLGWVLAGAVCFNLAYNWVSLPALGWIIFGYALALVQLTRQTSVRRAFYFGLATGYLSFAPQLLFMWHIFGPAAPVLWLVLAFWIGLFTAISCGARRRWGGGANLWLIPMVWTGVEYFRSELYYLKFSWLNLGYALTPLPVIGMYGRGFLVFALVALLLSKPKGCPTRLVWFGKVIIGVAIFIMALNGIRLHDRGAGPQLTITGIQLEFPNDYIVARSLDTALKKHPETQIFVLSEYTLTGSVPDSLKSWCRNHSRFLIVGGKEEVTNEDYYNTAYVVGTNGNIVFQQAKSVPIQFFKDGRPAPRQEVWNSPWGKIGICICYDLSYTRVTDELIRQGAQLLIVPTMDVAEWGAHQHELHSRVAPVRAAEYGVPVFRLASSGISQAVNSAGVVEAQTTFPGSGEILPASLRLPRDGTLPVDRYLAPVCVAATGLVTILLLWRARGDHSETSDVKQSANG